MLNRTMFANSFSKSLVSFWVPHTVSGAKCHHLFLMTTCQVGV